MKKIFILTILLFININIRAFEVKFDKCIDGDTFKVFINDESVSVRMLAVDSPEVNKKEKFAIEAKDYTCNKLKNAKKIELEYDDNSLKKDKYNRVLAWVFIDEALLQKDLVLEGYAKVAYLYGDYKYTHILKTAEEYAIKNNKGLWIYENSNDEDLDAIFDEFVLKIKNYILKTFKEMLYEIKDKIIKSFKATFI